MLLLAVAPSAAVLAAGVVVAGTSAGLAFPPYADVVAHRVASTGRGLAWSVISSGTGWGVALAIVCGARWRLVRLVFAVLAALMGAVAVRSAPRGRIGGVGGSLPRVRPSWLLCGRSGPLLLSCVLVGGGSSVWWAFSVDVLRGAGMAPTAARAVYAVAGVAGVVASATGPAADRWGTRHSYLAICLTLAASRGALGVTGGNPVAATLADAGFGVAYNGVIAVQGRWSAEVFADRPSAGQAAVNTALTLGMVAGPALAGAVISSSGYPPVLLGAAGALAVGIVLAPPGRPRPAL
jgi:predicted MFS family arabinose efflux permease